MRTTQQFSITLPTEMASLVKAKVACGEYATESEVIRDGLRVLMARDRAMVHWLQNQVGPAYDAIGALVAKRTILHGFVTARLSGRCIEHIVDVRPVLE